MQKKVQRLTYNIARHSHAIIHKYRFDAALCDVIYRGWVSPYARTLIQPGYTAIYSFDGGIQAVILGFGEELGSIKQRRQQILACLSSKYNELKPKMREIN